MRPQRDFFKPVLAFTGGMVFPDGRIVELLRDVKDGLACTLLFDPKKGIAEVKTCVADDGVVYQPIYEPREWVRTTRLPKQVSLQADFRDLFHQIMSAFSVLGAPQANCLAAWVMETWAMESMRTAPLLQVSGPHAESVMQALEMMCRRGVLVYADWSAGTVPELLQPTVLALTASPVLARKFLSPTPAGRPIWHGRKLANPHFARAVGYEGDATPVRGALNIVADQAVELDRLDADVLQSELLGWRLRHCTSLKASDESDPVLNNLMVTCSGVSGIAGQVRDAYISLVKPIQAEETREEDTAVIAVLSDLATESRAMAYVAEIAAEAEKQLRISGSYLSLNPRAAGEVLRRLGIPTERLGAAGRGVRFTAQNRINIDRHLARTHDAEPGATRQPTAAPDIDAGDGQVQLTNQGGHNAHL